MNYTGELLFGKYPVQRTNPKPGQSKWYYIDPRYNGLGEIDVESENSPNPYENEIKEYLYRNEPEHYKEMYGNEEPVHQNSSTVNQLTGMQTLAGNNTFQPTSMSVNASTKSLFPTLPPIQGVQLAQNGINKDEIFDRVLFKSLKEEGGYEDNAYKIDTPTNMGIQQQTLQRFKFAHPDKAQNYPQHVKDLNYQQAREIARLDYFDKYRIGEIQSKPLQETMFDVFYNHSPYEPALWAQKAINQNTNMRVVEDGKFGTETIKALNSLSSEEIIKVNNTILDMRQKNYELELQTNPNPNYKDFTKGLPDRFRRFRIK